MSLKSKLLLNSTIVYAMFFIVLAITTNSVAAKYSCKDLYDEAQYSEALEPCKKAAKENNLQAQTILGEMLDNGSAGIMDREQAYYWWSKAADKNFIEAENLLALKFYYGGTIIEKQKFWQQDYNKALAIWSKAARRGLATAQFMVAEMNHKGQGTPVNLPQAYAWFSLAVDGGYKLAQESLYEVKKALTAQDRKLAEQLYNDYKKKYMP